MTAAKKLKLMTMEQFEQAYKDTRYQFHEGMVWDEKNPSEAEKQLQAGPDHSYLQFCIPSQNDPIGSAKSCPPIRPAIALIKKLCSTNTKCPFIGSWTQPKKASTSWSGVKKGTFLFSMLLKDLKAKSHLSML